MEHNSFLREIETTHPILSRNSSIRTGSNTSLPESSILRQTVRLSGFFREVERRLPRFGSIDKIVVWHNEVKPHSSLNYDEQHHAFWYRLPPERILSYVKEWFYV